MERKFDKIYTNNLPNLVIREKTFKNLVLLLASYVPDTPPSVSLATYGSGDPSSYFGSVSLSRPTYIEMFGDKYTEIENITISPTLNLIPGKYVISGFKLSYTVVGIVGHFSIYYNYDKVEA